MCRGLCLQRRPSVLCNRCPAVECVVECIHPCGQLVQLRLQHVGVSGGVFPILERHPFHLAEQHDGQIGHASVAHVRHHHHTADPRHDVEVVGAVSHRTQADARPHRTLTPHRARITRSIHPGDGSHVPVRALFTILVRHALNGFPYFR